MLWLTYHIFPLPPGTYTLASTSAIPAKSGDPRMVGLLVGSPVIWLWKYMMMGLEMRYVPGGKYTTALRAEDEPQSAPQRALSRLWSD